MYSNFTNIYSLSKTLRFELKPTETTLQLMAQNGDVATDKDRHEAFILAKRMLDVVHQQFITESLQHLTLDATELQKYIDLATAKQYDKKQTEAALKPILARFSQAYSQANAIWQERYDYKKPFLTTNVTQLQLLDTFRAQIAAKLDLEDALVDETIEKFHKFATYFEGYRQNRLNMYSTDGKTTEVANRTISQNLITYYKNLHCALTLYNEPEALYALPGDTAQLFSLGNYSDFVSQDGIDTYNARIGALNSAINEARQQHASDKTAKKRLPLFRTLFKQILGDGTKAESYQTIKTTEEYEALIVTLQSELPQYFKLLHAHAAAHVENPANPEAVFITKKAVNTILAKHIDAESRTSVREALPERFRTKPRGMSEEEAVTANFVSLAEFFAAIDAAQQNLAEGTVLKDRSVSSENVSATVWAKFCEDLRAVFDAAETALKAFVEVDRPSTKPAREVIKLALDNFNDLYRMYTYFELRYRHEPVTLLDGDEGFYGIFQDTGEQADLFDIERDKRFSHSYDLIRNWLTKKPYSLDKWKLNFDCAQLLSGWDVNKEPEKHGALLFRGNEYYLTILTNQGKNALDRGKNPKLYEADSHEWQKMEYKLLPGPNKMLPKVLFSKKYRLEHGIPAEIDRLYKAGTFKKGVAFSLDDLHRLIDFYKSAIPTYPGWSMYEFAFRPTDKYQSIDEFYHEVELGGYKLDRVAINHAELMALEANGALYLFRITNKDLAHERSSAADLHTLYFKQAFTQGSSVKLNGEAEIFFRPKSYQQPTLPASAEPKDITKHRRFAEDKFFFHVPLTLNYQVKSLGNSAYNQHVMERVKTLGIKTVIGIDRGEKELGYITVCDIDGKLLQPPISLNTIMNESNPVKYYDLLKKREGERQENRQNWQAVEQIKSLKDGYVGHCVKLITDLAIKHKAIIVLENLNVGFKQGRSRIERSVYNQLEQALLKKLQYVVMKNTPSGQPFSTEYAVQLTPPDISPQATGNQMGWVFFVDPSYTSAIDPATGYRQHVRLGDEIKVANFAQFVQDAFDDISYDGKRLTFRFNWRTLATAQNKLKKPDARTQKVSEVQDKLWTIHANVPRTVYYRDKDNQSQNKVVNIQEKLLELLHSKNIPLQGDILQNIAQAKLDAPFVKEFVWCFNQLNRLRNTIDEQDTIISPAICKAYPHGFDSRKDTVQGYAWNGDANGAYHIGRKGTILLKKLHQAETIKDFKAVVKRAEYDQLVTGE